MSEENPSTRSKVKAAVLRNPNIPHSELATLVGVTKGRVSALRLALERSGEVPPNPRRQPDPTRMWNQVDRLLTRDPKRLNVHIANQLGISDTVVGRRRLFLEQQGRIPRIDARHNQPRKPADDQAALHHVGGDQWGWRVLRETAARSRDVSRELNAFMGFINTAAEYRLWDTMWGYQGKGFDYFFEERTGKPLAQFIDELKQIINHLEIAQQGGPNDNRSNGRDHGTEGSRVPGPKQGQP
jgi:DNA-binding Lrp family transcriptional regulator